MVKTNLLSEDDFLIDAAIGAAERRDRASWDLIQTLFCDPKVTVPIAEAEGVTVHHFEREDYKVLWCAAVAGKTCSRLSIFKAARTALQRAHYWDLRPGYMPVNDRTALWFKRKLGWLFFAWFPSPPTVRHRAAKLVAIDHQIRLASAHYAECRRLLAELAAPGAWPPKSETRGPSFLVPVGRERGAA